jgi:hypothetical protein
VSLEPDTASFLQWLRIHYETLPVILTEGASQQLTEKQRQQVKDAGANDLLSGFYLHGSDVATNSADIAQKVERLLNVLQKSFSAKALLQSSTSVLQMVIRNETLF